MTLHFYAAGLTSDATTSSSIAALFSSSAAASISQISSTTVSTASSVAAGALGNPQGERKTKDGQEEKKKSAEYDAVRGEQEIEQARRARELEASQRAISAASVAASALAGQQREYKGKDLELEWQQVLRTRPEERQKALDNFYAKFRPVVSYIENTSAEQPKKPSFVKEVTRFPTADLFRSMSARCLKFRGSSSLFSTHPLGLFSVNKGDAFFKGSLIKDIGWCATLIKTVQPIETNPGVVTLEASLEGRVEKDTGRSHLLVRCTPTSTTRPPCDIVFVTDEQNTLSDVELSLFDELTPFDRVACIKFITTSYRRVDFISREGRLIFPFTQVTEQNKVALRHKVTFLREDGSARSSFPDVVKGIFSAFEEMEKIDKGAHRARVVVWWQVGKGMPDFWLNALHANRSSTIPVVYCYPGSAGLTPTLPKEFTTFRHLGCCPIMGENINKKVKLSQLTQFSSLNACQITHSQLEIREIHQLESHRQALQVRDISCMGSLRVDTGSKSVTLPGVDTAYKSITVTGLSTGRFCRLNMPFTFGVECDGTPAAVSLQMAAEHGPWQVTPVNTQLTWKLEIQPTPTLSPFKTYAEGIVRILFEDKSNNYRNKARSLEQLMQQIPARHLVLLNNIAQIIRFIEGYYEVVATIPLDSHTQEKMKQLQFNLTKAIEESIILEYEWDQLPAHVRITGLFAEELEGHEILWKGTPQSLEERMKLGLFQSSPQIESVLGSLGFSRALQRLVMSYSGDVGTRYAAIEGVRNGLLCLGTVNRTEEVYGKEMGYTIEIDRKTRKEVVVEKEINLICHRFESIQFTPYSMQLNLGQLEQQTKWPEVVKQSYRDLLNFRVERDNRNNDDNDID